MPGVQLPSFNLFATDKLAHALIYGILVWLAIRGSYAFDKQLVAWKWAVGIFLFAVAYGMMMEFVQYAFIPGRFYEYGDMLANTVGATLGLLLSAGKIRRPVRAS